MVSKYDGSSVVNTLKINTTTNLVTLLGGISATTANFTGLLTGATATFTNSSSGIGVDVTNSGSGDGIKITHSLGRAFRIESSSTGYGILINNLTASTSVPFTIQKQGSTVITMSDTGAANFTGQLTLGSTITNGTYTYTLPSATGTLALTSALSGYLPLSGGTLTGPLGGTSASFSQGISADVGSATSSIQVRNASTDAPFIGFFRGGTLRNTLQLLTDGSFKLTDASLVANAGLTMGALSGTSASFTGAVTNRGLVIDGANNGNVAKLNWTRTDQSWSINNETNLRFYTSSGNTLSPSTQVLELASTGAATFTGDVAISKTSTYSQLQLIDNTASGSTWVTLSGFPALGDYTIREAGVANHLIIKKTTGAATFSGDVSLINSSSASLNIQGNSGNSKNIFFKSTGAADNSIRLYQDGGTNNFLIATGDGTVAPTTRLTIASNGNVSIGTTDTSQYRLLTKQSSTDNFGIANLASNGTSIIRMLHDGTIGAINVSYIGGGSYSPLAFFTSDTERMRITSGGFTKSSNTGTYFGSTGDYHETRTNQQDWVSVISNTNASNPYGLFLNFTGATPNNTGNEFLYCRDGGITVRATIRSNGGIANYSANDVNLSDERTKKDIEPLESYWDKFKAIEIVKFKYKDQTHDDFNIGLIAQQVEAVAPEFVDVDGWDNKPKLDEEGNEIINDEEPLKSIYTADLYHATIKVVQECMSKIEELKAEIDLLKGKPIIP